MSDIPKAQSRPSRKPAEADLRGTMNRSESMDGSAPHFVPSQPKHKNRESISSSGPSVTSPPSTRGCRAEVIDNRTVSQSLQDWMENRVSDIIKTICDTTSIPQKVQHKVSIELQNLVVDFAAQQVFVTKTEEQYMNQVKDLERQLLEASSDFSDESGEPTRCELLAIIASQREELQVKENQLNGKRILWLASHPPASQLRSSETNPFRLPGGSSRSHSQLQLEAPPSFKNSHSGYRSGGPTSMTRLSRASLAAMENAAIGDHMSPTQEEYDRVKASVSVAVPDSALENVPSVLNMRNTMRSETETVINHRRSQVMPLVPYKSQPSNVHDTGKEFTNDFGNLFASMEGWCREYACVPNLAGDRNIASTNQELWNYMMGVTYHDPQSAHSHVMALLGNENTRFWFVMRLALEYCFKKIMCIETYEKYNQSVKEHLISLRERLAAKPIISNEKRQALIAEQTALIKSVINSPDYVTFRNDMLVHHTKRLRDILGPLMNQGCSRTKAGGDLGVMIISSMEICAKMWTAKLSFQIVFPDLLGVKFTAGTMTPKDHPRDNPYQLQTKQKRLKLVMTPSITMRDDNSITIIAKNLHKANVLLMT
ncbi:hypothetical protein SS1G_00130 [Sclerotinia sclerotiorum 1980 UF-70]|uniref:Uncharacterized protein n=2 Tax=Sclerotinia sclerotiorum (strain ATCC 18683 / 1980 / Ss-1) TaxID=665079 RepID=A7E4A8_SCLS1|nr:hypothetical protein SS1G_00130 [Sclerotinia sclerotiorum 1980 UF-70]APA08177.1 hypothetical protein sscle_03g029470 [Sclerotinia sclerotiorum 1980 UF-70]EDN90730.1 hypothetical protein SS1G_00130 [Sclerotinia sclerotiorum 1980 UF-70]